MEICETPNVSHEITYTKVMMVTSMKPRLLYFKTSFCIWVLSCVWSTFVSFIIICLQLCNTLMKHILWTSLYLFSKSLNKSFVPKLFWEQSFLMSKDININKSSVLSCAGISSTETGRRSLLVFQMSRKKIGACTYC